MPQKITIEVRGRKFTCPAFTTDHAIFFGTLLMDADELRIFNDEENPSKAMQAMNDRLRLMGADLRSRMGKDISEAELQSMLDKEVIDSMVNRILVRVNQDKDGVRYKLARRLREVFPDFPDAWVSAEALHLEPLELLTAVALPLFGYMTTLPTEQAWAPNEPVASTPTLQQEIQQVQPDRPAPKGFGAVARTDAIVQAAAAEVAAEAEPPEDDRTVTARQALAALPPELRSRLLNEVGQEPG